MTTTKNDEPRLTLGSTWRRWDPHLHLPGTLHEDRFGELTVEQALDDLANCTPSIEAVGITDYFTTLSYRRAEQAWRDGSGAGIKLLFPNVEVSLAIPTRSGSAVNVHLMTAPNHVDWLDQFLAGLTFSWDDRVLHASDSGLVDLGRSFGRNPRLEEHAARHVGANQFKVSFEDLRKRVKEDRLAGTLLLLGVAGGEGDGSSGVRTDDGAFQALRQAIERLAHVVFSGNPKQTQYWTGQGVDSMATLGEKYGGAKLCLHGSDAHARAQLGMPMGNRYTWIKGDATFEALQFASLAPDSRGWIGDTNPSAGLEHGRISSVSVSGGWFSQGSVPINAGLVAIIGPRGSGKTALADLIAAGAGSTEPADNASSFIRRAGYLLNGCKAEVAWRGQGATSYELAAPPSSDVSRVRYLSQQFVERLCASDGVSDELLTEIERVIYNAWPVEDRLGATDFQQLLKIRLAPARNRQEVELDALGQISDEIIGLRVLQNSLAAKTNQHTTQTALALTLDGQIKELTAHSGGVHAERHGIVSGALGQRQEVLQSIDRQRNELRAIQRAVGSATTTSFPQYVAGLKAQYPLAGLSEEAWRAFVPTFTGNVHGILSAAITEADKSHADLVGAEPSKPTNLDSIRANTATVVCRQPCPDARLAPVNAKCSTF